MFWLNISNTALPILGGCDLLAASEPFFHADRTVDFNILIYVTEGVIYVTEEDTDYEISAGELLLLKSGVHHFGRKEIPKGTKWFFAHFYCDDNKELTEFTPDSSPIPQYTTLQSRITLPKKLSGLSGSDTERDISELVELYRSDSRYKGWYLNQRLFMLLSKLAMSRYSSEKAPSLSDRICAYLAAHRDEPFSAAAVSGEFFLTYKHLAAVFKREKGETMQQYHTKLRMDEACRLLRSTLLPVGEIASYLGYGDMLYFSRCFHTAIGCSPTEYRKKTPMY